MNINGRWQVFSKKKIRTGSSRSILGSQAIREPPGVSPQRPKADRNVPPGQAQRLADLHLNQAIVAAFRDHERQMPCA
jgi:hypothetical protein